MIMDLQGIHFFLTVLGIQSHMIPAFQLDAEYLTQTLKVPWQHLSHLKKSYQIEY